ncbi:MAG TPA: aspartyl protease family protein [Stellaceae bacterium]|nr:aspartyl protease family protein [Stellaceae bacterium]
MRGWLLAAWTVVGLAAGLVIPNAAAADCVPRRIATLPATRGPDGTFRVPAQMDGMPTLLLLDTGGGASMIGPALVAALKLPVEATGMTVGGLDGSFSARSVTVPELRLGEEIERDRAFLVQPIPEGRPGPNYGGVLAADLLKLRDIELDPTGDRVSLYAQDHCGRPPTSWSGAAYEMPILVTPDLHIRLEVRIGDAIVGAWLDSGAGVSWLSRRAAQTALGLSRETLERDPAARIVGAGGQSIAARAHRFPSIRLDSLALSNWPVLIAADEDEPASMRSADMIIGMDVIGRFRMFVAYDDQALYFMPAEPVR